ncbi:MAG: NAD(P)H-binding protein [Solirubrobacterales bacterium]|nr:NAD(P)H-binding protein [Solirubrobacterales bacterium]
MQILVTGVTGYVGSELVPRLKRDGHALRGFARAASQVSAPVDETIQGDAISGVGLDRALAGIEVAYYLIHSMQRARTGATDPAVTFDVLERTAAENFAAAAERAGVRRVVYLGGLVPQGVVPSRHLRSRLAVEEIMLSAAPEAIALRASILIAARSRSFRFLVRLIERLPVLALPSWRDRRTRPIDGRDALEFLARSATIDAAQSGRSWDIAGPDELSYSDMVRRIADVMLVDRPSVGINLSLTPVASAVAAAIAGEDPGLIEPLMESLEHDLLPRHEDAARNFEIRPRRFDAAVERALREWEGEEQLAAR